MASGDIWSTGAFAFESPLSDLLNSLDYTLEDLLAEDELLQELRGLHPQLVSFFSTEENVAGLVKFLITPPPSLEEVLVKDDQKNDVPKIDNIDEVSIDQELEKSEVQTPVETDDGVDIPKTPEQSSAYEPIENEEINDQNIDDVDLSADFSSSDSIPSPGKWLLENTTEAVNESTVTTENTGTVNSREDYEKMYIRFPYMACELICCEVPTIIDILVEGQVPIEKVVDDNDSDDESKDEISLSSLPCNDGKKQSILDLLFSMLHNTPENQLDDRRAGYLEKILTMLFQKKRTEMVAYVNGDHLKGKHEDDQSQNVDSIHKDGGENLLLGLFKHLYSNSIAQILQRLLMPKPPSFGDMDDEQNEDHHEWPMNCDDDEDGNLGEHEGLDCDWVDSRIGIGLLLDHLLIDSYTMSNSDSKEDNLKLNASQHACEILTTVIQHSPLSSNVMKTMTGEPILERLMKCACGISSTETIPSTFSLHDSTMTTAMNVLEILILQLGGYGTVPTDDVEGEFDQSGKAEPTKDDQSVYLIRLLPDFLGSLCSLLKHPDTKNWKSHFQFCSQPQKMLGASRLRIVRLIESLVLLSIRAVDLMLTGSECLEICLDLFWEFPWCSMLHQSVANLLVHVLEGGEDRVDLQIYFLSRCNLPKRLMGSFDSILFTSNSKPTTEDSILETSLPNTMQSAENAPASDVREVASKKTTTFRMGYMGHVIIICQALVHACGPSKQAEDSNGDKDSIISRLPPRNMVLSLLRANRHYNEWNNFISTTLASETAVQSTPLGGFNAQEELNIGREDNTESTWNSNEYDDNSDNYIVGSDDIVLNEDDLDIAASMMESMNLNSDQDMNGDNSDVSNGHHRRQRGVISGQTFGSTVDIANQKASEYVYDDPLRVQHFGDDFSDDFANNEDDDDSDEDEAPVLDLFAGNFNFDSVMETNNAEPEGWAKFDANFDDAFSDAADFPTETTQEKDKESDIFGMVANNASALSSFSKNEPEPDKS